MYEVVLITFFRLLGDCNKLAILLNFYSELIINCILYLAFIVSVVRDYISCFQQIMLNIQYFTFHIYSYFTLKHIFIKERFAILVLSCIVIKECIEV
jgi:hypothetical protein